jgi:hypothetical protein
MSVDRGAFGAGDGYRTQMREQYRFLGLDPANLGRQQWTTEEIATINANTPVDMVEVDGVWMTPADARAAKG